MKKNQKQQGFAIRNALYSLFKGGELRVFQVTTSNVICSLYLRDTSAKFVPVLEESSITSGAKG
jgi:hypothetical protein